MSANVWFQEKATEGNSYYWIAFNSREASLSNLWSVLKASENYFYLKTFNLRETVCRKFVEIESDSSMTQVSMNPIFRTNYISF